MRHFAANVWKRQKSKEVVGELKQLCTALEERDFNRRLGEVRALMNEGAKEWLEA